MLTFDGVEVLSMSEAARYVGRTPETVRRWIWSGRLQARRDGNRLLVARADLDALKAARSRGVAPLRLAEWSELLAQGSGPSAADLVLDDRAGREA